MSISNRSRRDFLAKSAIAAAGIGLSTNVFSRPGNIRGANDRVRMGFIGVGNRGSQLMNLFMNHKDCEISALCDVYEPYMSRNRNEVDPRYIKDMAGQIPKMGEQFSVRPKIYKDWRKLLEDKDIDAVCIATPDHWHALQTIEAVKAGKDVYIEKPLTATIVEGRKMLEAEAAGKQLVAVGLNRRGSAVYRKLISENTVSTLGKITVARAARINDMYPSGVGRMSAESPPSDFDWDMWLGPRAYRPYQYNIAPYKFRWWSDYSTQMGNWGVHYMDVIRWLAGERWPVAVSAIGSKYAVDHDGDIPDTMQVTFEFASGMLITFGLYEACGGGFLPYGEIELRGTQGTLYVSERGYQIAPSNPGQFQTWRRSLEAVEYTHKDELLSDGSSGGSTASVVRNFLDCVKSRQKPFCTLEDGHISTSYAHLANIALATKERLEWDAEKERFTNSKKANDLLHYEYRKPWKL